MNLLIICKSAKSAAQRLPIKDECNFNFSNVIIIDLWSFSANSLFFMISLLTTLPPTVFLSKNVWAIEARPLWYPWCFGFLAILNALSCNPLSEAYLLGKSLKSP